MKITLAFLIFLLSGTAASESLTEHYCKKVQNYAQEVIPQLPMRMDAATTWMGISAIYAKGQCRVYHQYRLDSAALIESVVKYERNGGQDSTTETVTARLQSEAGLETLKENVRKSVARRIPEMMSIPNVVYQADYSSAEPLESFTVQVHSDQEP